MLKLRSNLFGKSLAAIALVGAAGSVANADLAGAAFRIEASNGTGSGVLEWGLNDLTYDKETNTWSWSQGSSIEILDEDEDVVATLQNANVYIQGDPSINLGFAVQAGDTDTTFTITTALLSFATIQNADGQAGAGFTITDVDNNGAVFTAGNGTGHGYLAQYNGVVPTGTDFTRLIGDFSSGAGKSASSSDNDPANGYRPVGGDVDDMSARVQFTLSANDLASGTNSYEIVPEPSALLLAALGALALIRRKG
jgi:hypothetical protein